MDILENGADRRPVRRGTRVVLLVALVAAVLAAIVLGGKSRSRQQAAPPVLPSVPTPVDAALVDTGGGSTYRSNQETKEFVISVDLHNFNRVPAHVVADSVPDQPAFDQLVAAVQSAEPARNASIATVAAAARTPVTIAGRGQGQLVVAGRLVCGVAPTSGSDFTIRVDGVTVTVELPRFGGESWVTEIVKELCPAR